MTTSNLDQQFSQIYILCEHDGTEATPFHHIGNRLTADDRVNQHRLNIRRACQPVPYQLNNDLILLSLHVGGLENACGYVTFCMSFSPEKYFATTVMSTPRACSVA